ncbi:DMT family transporter [Bacillus sp. CGMCC 1.16607]|uniref:DMT family transporter n=1 Tax=Bacillus sp. CGMCC 1.16607 TaxID=3351842 RepID=UPI00363D6A54
MKNSLSILMIAVAASLWGIIALFVKELAVIGFSPMEIVSIRVTVAFFVLLIIGISFCRTQLIVKTKDMPIFFGSGIISIVFFNWCYFTTINQMNLSLAVILLYTSPAIVVILSRLFFKESLTKQKIIAVIGTLIGCIFITGVGSDSTGDLTIIGLLTGLGSGLGYALYSIFGKIALKKYPPFTITIYTFLFATVFLLPLTTLWDKRDLLFQANTLLWALGLGILPTVLAYFLYTKGLDKIESSKAAIIATVEPIVATILGIILYKEGMGVWQMVGTGLIFMSVIIVNMRMDRKTRNISLNTEKV